MTNQQPQPTKAVRFASDAPAVIPFNNNNNNNNNSAQPQHHQIGSSSSSLQQWIDLAPLHQQIKADVKLCKQSCPEAANLYTLFDCPVQERIAFLVRLNNASQHARGLERHLCKRHKVQLQCIKKGAIQAVLNLQKQYRNASTATEDELLVAEKLREISEQHSRSARVFARLLALADEQVLKEDQTVNAQRQPRSKSESLVRSTGAGDRLAQMQQMQIQERSATSTTVAAAAVVAIKRSQPQVAIALPPPVGDCDRHQTVSNAA